MRAPRLRSGTIGVRLARTVGVLLVVSIMVFLALRLTPGDPAALLLGPQAQGQPGYKAEIAALHRQMGLNEPLPVQYLIWIKGIVTGNFGKSNQNGAPVLHMLLAAAPPTLFLIGLSLIIAIPISIIIGTVAAYRRSGIVDRLVRALAALSLATPTFWLGILLILLFAVRLHALPATGYVSPLVSPVQFARSMALPVATVVVYLTGVLTRYVYAEMCDVCGQDYIRTVRALGIAERVVLFRYALRNALIPLIAIVGIQFAALISGAILVEQVFGLGGVGQLMLQGVVLKDYPLVQGGVLLITIVVIVVNTVADLLSRWADPRLA
jgi:peptide/nickel transport system permease protein